MSDDKDKYVLSIDEIPKHDNQFKDMIEGKDSGPALTLSGPMTQEEVHDAFMSVDISSSNSTDIYGDPGYSVVKTRTKPVYQIHIGDTLTDAQRYRWLKEHVFEVLCEGRPADCNAKWMLPRLVAEDSTGRKFTFGEIIDIQMKRSGDEG